MSSTTAARRPSTDDPNAVWNVFDSQLSGATWTVKQVSNTPNRVGPVCLEGDACVADRELLDLFEVAEDPITGKAAIVYTDTTISTWTKDGVTNQLPEDHPRVRELASAGKALRCTLRRMPTDAMPERLEGLEDDRAALDSKSDRVVAVTGAGTGIGQAIAAKFGALGWRVAVGGRRVDKLARDRGSSSSRRAAGASRTSSTSPTVIRSSGSSPMSRRSSEPSPRSSTTPRPRATGRSTTSLPPRSRSRSQPS